MEKIVHTFDNNIRVYEHQLLDVQKERYVTENVHEAEEEPIFLEVIAQLPKGGVYVNIGAAIGYYPLLAASMRDDLRLISYEPLKMHRRYFVENIKLNEMCESRFTIYKEGVFKRRGFVNFIADSYGSMIDESKRKRNIFQKIVDLINNDSIRCITLKDVADRENCDIELLQMDIQGLEAGVLMADESLLSSHRIKRFLIGTHSIEIHQRCLDVMVSNGYEVMVDQYETQLQPDGIILASCDRL